MKSAKTNPPHFSKLRMTLLFGKTFGTFTDLLQHPFKLLQLFWRDVLERTFDECGVPAKERDEDAAIRGGRLEGFEPAEAALLRMADAMADTPSNVSDELYTELRRYFSEEQVIELAASAAQKNFRARWNRVFDVRSDGLYRRGLQFKQRRVA